MSRATINAPGFRRGGCRQVAFIVVLAMIAGSCARTDDTRRDRLAVASESIAHALERLEKADDAVEYSVWLGPPDGGAWFEYNANRIRPAASAIKTAILIEFLDTQIDSLDTPFEPLNKILDDPDGAAIRHFSSEQKTTARNELRGLTARQVAEAMVHKEHVESNAAYNAAANVIIEYLGGPAALSERIRRRFPSAERLQISRYMLADRHENGDNLLTAGSLAVVLRSLAHPAPASEWRDAARAVLFLESGDQRGDHYYKGGSLKSDPQVRIEAGWWDNRGAACVYIVIATRPNAARNDGDYDALRSNLADLSELVQGAGLRLRDTLLAR